jgi:hypothetical protein
MHDDDARPVHDPDPDGSVGAAGEPIGVDERARAQLVEVEVGVAELEQPRAELVLVGVAVLLDEAVCLERLQQAVHGGAGEVETVGDLADAETAGTARQHLQNAGRAIDRLDRAATLGLASAIRHCRIVFDSVD